MCNETAKTIRRRQKKALYAQLNLSHHDLIECMYAPLYALTFSLGIDDFLRFTFSSYFLLGKWQIEFCQIKCLIYFEFSLFSFQEN